MTRPSRHIRNVPTSNGRRTRLINPNILKTNREGLLPNLDVNLESGDTVLPPIRTSRFGEHGSGNVDENINKMMEIYNSASPSEVDIPTRDELTEGNTRYYFIKTSAGRVVGAGGIKLYYRTILRVYILPHYRGNNYDKSFVKLAEDLIRQRGDSYAVLIIKPASEVAVWRGFGYTRLRGTLSNGCIKLKKPLTQSAMGASRIMKVI